MVPCTNPAADDAPYVLIDQEPSVKMSRILVKKMVELQASSEDADGSEIIKQCRQIDVGSDFLVYAMACGIAKLGGNWELYVYEWGEAAPKWPRVVRTDDDMATRVETASNIDRKTANDLVTKINGYMKVTEEEAGK